MSRNDDYAKENSLEYLYHQKKNKNYKSICIDFLMHTSKIFSQQIKSTKLLEEDNGAKMASLLKSSKKLF